MLLALSLGLHWTVMQSFAWAGMLVRRAQTETFAVALKTTFDGQHPCQVCKAVAAGKAAERHAEGTSFLPKLEICNAVTIACWIQPPSTAPLRVFENGVQDRGDDAPPLPPPRSC